MNTLKAMEVFVAVAEHQAFAQAARALNLSATAVSRHIQELEDWLGVELLRRTTRKVSLTEAGRRHLSKCQSIVNDVRALHADAHEKDIEPSGTLRLTAPAFIAKKLLAELLPSYLNTYPKVELDLLAIDREIDLVAEGFDLALRIGELADSTLIARKVRDVSLYLVASPEYLRVHGSPAHLSDLAGHNCLVDTVPRYGDRWPLRDASFKKHFRARGNVRVNSGEIIESMVLNGMGIAYLPDFFVFKHLAEGRLTRLLKDVRTPVLGMYLVYPQTHHVSRKLRTFVDFLMGHASQLDTLYSSE